MAEQTQREQIEGHCREALVYLDLLEARLDSLSAFRPDIVNDIHDALAGVRYKLEPSWTPCERRTTECDP